MLRSGELKCCAENQIRMARNILFYIVKPEKKLFAFAQVGNQIINLQWESKELKAAPPPIVCNGTL